MNWQGHKQLYESVNLAKILFVATEQWKDYDCAQEFGKKRSTPKLKVIDGDKE